MFFWSYSSIFSVVDGALIFCEVIESPFSKLLSHKFMDKFPGCKQKFLKATMFHCSTLRWQRTVSIGQSHTAEHPIVLQSFCDLKNYVFVRKRTLLRKIVSYSFTKQCQTRDHKYFIELVRWKPVETLHRKCSTTWWIPGGLLFVLVHRQHGPKVSA